MQQRTRVYGLPFTINLGKHRIIMSTSTYIETGKQEHQNYTETECLNKVNEECKLEGVKV